MALPLVSVRTCLTQRKGPTLTFTGRTLSLRAGHFRGRFRAAPDLLDVSCGAQWKCQGEALDTDLKEVHEP